MKVSRWIGAGVAAAALAFTGLVNQAVAEGGPARAQVGAAAPAFSLEALDGTTHTLEQYKGKVVVLEWFNPECPIVVRHYRANTMKQLAARYKDQDVVWLAINSGADGVPGSSKERNQEAVEAWGIEYPVLLDPSGATGRLYDAKTTPHMYVIDREGVLRYAGAIDSDPRGKSEQKTNYVAQALDAVLAGQQVPTATTNAYGCGVKYARP
jgi:peroxiredoxin